MLAPINRLVTRIGMGGSANLLTVPAVAYELVGVLETVLLLGGGLWPARTRFFWPNGTIRSVRALTLCSWGGVMDLDQLTPSF